MSLKKRKASSFHRHAPIALVQANALAITPKHNDPVSCRGDVQKCDCGALVFFPHTLGLYPVEVEVVEQKKSAKTAEAA